MASKTRRTGPVPKESGRFSHVISSALRLVPGGALEQQANTCGGAVPRTHEFLVGGLSSLCSTVRGKARMHSQGSSQEGTWDSAKANCREVVAVYYEPNRTLQ